MSPEETGVLQALRTAARHLYEIVEPGAPTARFKPREVREVVLAYLAAQVAADEILCPAVETEFEVIPLPGAFDLGIDAQAVGLDAEAAARDRARKPP